MSTNTTNYQLIKPDRTDNVLVEDINYNTEIIDQELKKNETNITNSRNNYVAKVDVATETIKGISQIATQTEVNNGLEDTKIVTSKKLKARLDTLLADITSTYVLKTDNATETVAGIVKIATQSEINAGVDDTKIITSKKLASMLNSTYIKNTDLADVTIRNQWKVIFDGGFGVQGGVVATLPGDWSDCLVYYGVYSATENRIDNSSMLITSSEKGGKNMVYYVGDGFHEIKINVNNINQVVLVDRYGDAVVNKVLYKNNR